MDLHIGCPDPADIPFINHLLEIKLTYAYGITAENTSETEKG
jgi:hypothetical protein